MDIVKLVVQARQDTGKGTARRLRSAGHLPAVLYGNGTTVSLTLTAKDLVQIQQSESGENTILDFVIEGAQAETCHAILREIQIDPVKRTPLHADFYRVDMTKPITVTVPLEFTNEPQEMLKRANAHISPLWREIQVACLPRDIPDVITVDLSLLQLGEALKAGTLPLPPGVTLETDPEEAIVTITSDAEGGATAEGRPATEA